MSKKIKPKSFEGENKNVKKNPAKHPGVKPDSIRQISFKNFIPLGIIFIVFLILWFKPYNVKILDPWYEGIVLMDSAKKVKDIKEQNRLLDEAGKMMAEQVKKFPYHARVHFLYGYYWINRQNWDSAIFHQKEAIRIGAGGIINQVEFDAQGMLNSALGNKVIELCNGGKFKDAFDELEKAKTPNMPNPGIDKYRGIIYSRQGNADSALVYFFRYMKTNPNDADNLTNIGISYSQKNMRDSSLKYINKALQIDPNNANTKFIKGQITGQKQ